MYHHVGDASEGAGLNVSVENFERQMEFLKVHNFSVIGLDELIYRLKAGKKIPRNTTVITFDDGNLDNFKNAFPVLKKMNFTATIFVITSRINTEGYLSDEDLRILNDAGITIGSHTVTHAFMPDLKPEEVLLELRESKRELESILGHPVTIFSYPAGGFNGYARAMVKAAGYEGAVTTNWGKTRHDPFALHRIKATDSRAGLFSFWMKTTGFYHLGKSRVKVSPSDGARQNR
jgi:peptidoglycan/xylan/chitin deacetylase (PgdA/CDA1 family)